MPRTGRPRLVIDWSKVNKLARLHTPKFDIAALMGVSLDTLHRACQRDNGKSFAEFIHESRSHGRQCLRNIQLKSAKAGNVAMQIWLGKQWLAQTDKIVRYDGDWAKSQSREQLLKMGQQALEVLAKAGQEE